MRASVLAALAAGALAGIDEELVKQHTLMFASYMDQDDEADGFHTEDFEAELQHIQRQHARLKSAGAQQPSLGPLIEQALKDPQSLDRVTESIANLGADGNPDAQGLHRQLMDADPTLGQGWAERRRLQAVREAEDQRLQVPDVPSPSGMGALGVARGPPGFGFRAGGYKSLSMAFRGDIDAAAHQLRREDYRSDEL